MPTITIPEETYQRLTRHAADMKTTVEALATTALEHIANVPQKNGHQVIPPGDLPYAEWKKLFDEHMKIVSARADRYPPGHITDSSRESIYEGCGQ